ITVKKLSMTVLAIISILGIYTILKGKVKFYKQDKVFMFLLIILPLAFLLNMLFLGFDTHHLDRPFRLILGIFAFSVILILGFRIVVLYYGIATCLLYASILSFYELYILKLERAHSFMAPIPFGNFAILLGLIMIVMIYMNKEIKNGYKFLVAFPIFVMSLWISVASKSRGGWIVLPFLIFIVSLAFERIKIVHRVIVVLLIVFLMVIVYFKVGIVKNKIDEAINEAATYIKIQNKSDVLLGSFGTRLEMWRYGIVKFLESPIWGKGYVKFEEELEEDIKSKKTNPELARHGHLHNDIITFLAKQGLVGVVFYIIFYTGLFIFFYKKVRRFEIDWRIRALAMGGLLTICGMFLFSLSDSMFGTAAGISNYVFLLSLFAGGMRYYENLDLEIKGGQ
ncbi:MAG: O-antigen ligase family protein, partial [Calditerrivibrio sp.]|nr:O-antigen ligase family protein [Calditerrivibrio sp.]